MRSSGHPHYTTSEISLAQSTQEAAHSTTRYMASLADILAQIASILQYIVTCLTTLVYFVVYVTHMVINLDIFSALGHHFHVANSTLNATLPPFNFVASCVFPCAAHSSTTLKLLPCTYDQCSNFSHRACYGESKHVKEQHADDFEQAGGALRRPLPELQPQVQISSKIGSLLPRVLCR